MRIRRDLIGKIYFLLSMDRIESALTEANFIANILNLRIIHMEPGIIIFDREDRIYDEDFIVKLTENAPSMIKELGITLWVFEDIDNVHVLKETLGSLKDLLCVSGELRIRVIKDKYIRVSPHEITKLLDRCHIEDADTSIIIGNLVIVGRALYRRELGVQESIKLDESATMKVIDARYLSNLIVRKSDENLLIYDPFGGAGYLLYESCKKGFRVVLSDIDIRKIYKAREVFTRNNCLEHDLFQADAFKPPLRSGSVNSVISDIPYGRRSRIVSMRDFGDLVMLLNELMQLIKAEGSVILAMSYDQWKYLRERIRLDLVWSISLQYLHSNFHRVYLVLKKDMVDRLH